ncbi:MAG: phospho-N-acetylmuramoyl-pentapeptide-transferase, partial [Actinobacteria bacterium]|nr:phospho-N-acetylmuramoyl-pentapeptide-transferase [Actinomycetota bacterium]
ALNGFLIALCANLYNLLDMRPGRAIKCFLPVLGLIIAVNWGSNYMFASYLLSTGCISLALFYGDLREIFMLGDAGSNVLGAIIGLGVAVSVSPLWRLVALTAVLALNLLSEAVSFSGIIDSVGALKWIDRLGRKGLDL